MQEFSCPKNVAKKFSGPPVTHFGAVLIYVFLSCKTESNSRSHSMIVRLLDLNYQDSVRMDEGLKPRNEYQAFPGPRVVEPELFIDGCLVQNQNSALCSK